MANPALDFQATLVERGVTLSIEYTVKNQTANDIGLFNRITAVRPDGTLLLSSDLAYVELQDELLLVRKLALPIPEGLRMAAYVPPYVSRVAAEELFVEHFSLTLPARVMQPFKRALLQGQVAADKPAVAKAVRLEIGYFALDSSAQLSMSNPAYPQLFSAMPPGVAVSRQHVFSRDFALRQAVPVLDYRAVPWR